VTLEEEILQKNEEALPEDGAGITPLWRGSVEDGEEKPLS